MVFRLARRRPAWAGFALFRAFDHSSHDVFACKGRMDRAIPPHPTDIDGLELEDLRDEPPIRMTQKYRKTDPWAHDNILLMTGLGALARLGRAEVSLTPLKTMGG